MLLMASCTGSSHSPAECGVPFAEESCIHLMMVHSRSEVDANPFLLRPFGKARKELLTLLRRHPQVRFGPGFQLGVTSNKIEFRVA